MFKALIIGAGRYGGGSADALQDNHAQMLSRVSGIRLEACADPNLERARNLDRQRKARVFRSHIEALSENFFDVVTVVTPDSSHFQVSRDVLESSRPPRVLIIEKPVCLELAQLRELQIIARRTETLVVVNNKYRLQSSLRSLRAAIARRKWGPLVELRAHYYGSWARNGSHMIDLINFLAGESALCRKIDEQVSYLSPKQFGASVTGALGENGPPFSIDWFDERVFQIFELDIRFTSGRVQIEDFGKRIISSRTVKNAAGESELVSFRGSSSRIETDSMNIYLHILKFLQSEELGNLGDLTLEHQENSVSTLAQVSTFIDGRNHG